MAKLPERIIEFIESEIEQNKFGEIIGDAGMYNKLGLEALNRRAFDEAISYCRKNFDTNEEIAIDVVICGKKIGTYVGE